LSFVKNNNIYSHNFSPKKAS